MSGVMRVASNAIGVDPGTVQRISRPFGGAEEASVAA